MTVEGFIMRELAGRQRDARNAQRRVELLFGACAPAFDVPVKNATEVLNGMTNAEFLGWLSQAIEHVMSEAVDSVREVS